MATITGSKLGFINSLQDPSGISELNGAQDIAVRVINGVTYVYVAARVDDGIEVLTLDADGTLTQVGRVLDTPGTTLNNVWEMEIFAFEGTDYLIANGELDDGLTLFSLSDTAPYLSFVNAIVDLADPSTNLNAPVGLAVVQNGAGTFIYAGGFLSKGISVFQVGTGGTLTAIQNIDTSSSEPLLTPTSVHGFEHFGVDYMAVAASGTDELSVFAVSPSGG